MSERLPESSEPPSPEPARAGPWERELLERLAFAALAEQRRSRRWGIAFKIAFLVYLVAVLVVYAPRDWHLPGTGARHTALVELRGTIAANSDASAERVVKGLRTAFDDAHTAGVILRIDSPGGSPVQAGRIYDAIRRLRKEHPAIRLYAVIGDICASGGYYVAAAADRIYADKASVVGSIGVLMNGFGFVGTLDKLGVQRRLITSGEHKGFLDPFSPEKPAEVAHLQRLLDQIHRQFIDAVKRGRGARLAHDDKLFSGLVWTGEDAVRLGLVDGLGSSSYVAREVIGAKRIVDYTSRRGYVGRLVDRFTTRLGHVIASEVGLDAPPSVR